MLHRLHRLENLSDFEDIRKMLSTRDNAVETNFSDALNTPKADLWALAISKVSPDDRALIELPCSDKLQLLRDVAVATEEKKKLCIQKRWKYTRRNGETIILRDVLNKILTWVDKFKTVMDMVVQYDPGHAALPWACVRFILQVRISLHPHGDSQVNEY